MGVSKNRGTPKWFIMENPIKIHDLGVPLLLETSICKELYSTPPKLVVAKPHHRCLAAELFDLLLGNLGSHVNLLRCFPRFNLFLHHKQNAKCHKSQTRIHKIVVVCFLWYYVMSVGGYLWYHLDYRKPRIESRLIIIASWKWSNSLSPYPHRWMLTWPLTFSYSEVKSKIP